MWSVLSADVRLSCNPQQVPQRRWTLIQRSRLVSGSLLSTSHFPLPLFPAWKLPWGSQIAPGPREEVPKQPSLLLCRWRGRVTGRSHTCSMVCVTANPLRSLLLLILWPLHPPAPISLAHHPGQLVQPLQLASLAQVRVSNPDLPQGDRCFSCPSPAVAEQLPVGPSSLLGSPTASLTPALPASCCAAHTAS